MKNVRKIFGILVLLFIMAISMVQVEAAGTESIALKLEKEASNFKATATVTNGTFSKFVYSCDGSKNYEYTGNPLKIGFPTSEGTHTLKVTAYTKSGLSKTDTITHTIGSAKQESLSLKLEKDSSNFIATATVTNGTFAKFVYSADGSKDYEYTKNPMKMALPTTEGTHTLKVTAYTKSGVSKTSTITHTVGAAKQESVALKLEKETSNFKATATVTNGTFAKFVYSCDGSKDYEYTSNPMKIALPTAAGTHTLKVTAYTKSGLSKSATITHTVEAPKTESLTLKLEKEESNFKATATVTNGTFAKFVYSADGSQNYEYTSNPMRIALPTSEGTHTLKVTAYTKSGLSKTATITHTVASTKTESLTLKLVKENDYFQATATVVNGTFAKFVYSCDGEAQKEYTKNPMKMALPTAVGTHTWKVTAYTASGMSKTDTITYVVEKTAEEKIDLQLSKEAANFKAVATVTNGTFAKFVYSCDGVSNQEYAGNPMRIAFPTSVGTHTLKVTAYTESGLSKSASITHTIEAQEPEQGGELQVPAWMVENENAEGLIVSLRNDSETYKSNNNFYQLDEEVIYYVDYMNAGREIDDEVKLVLKLPLAFAVVDADKGTVDASKRTITWTFANGLAKNAQDTKVVVIKYTSLSKSSNVSEMVYPQATIYKKNVSEDVSAVINCIYLDSDTEFDVEHEPYMYGDLEAPTFRPDEGITRAEGAMVLLRIFGEDYSKVKRITTKYEDIEDTYYVAQQAITKATELNIMSGYPNGTFRPNEIMTRAEFMRVIASYIEETAQIEGLEIKDETAVMLYKNSEDQEYWANPYITLLARLNMTSASIKEKDLRPDDIITRAEVAQLCNYFLFRAPAKVTAKTEVDFEDVSKGHKLVGDIIEATRAAHLFVVTVDGKERAK